MAPSDGNVPANAVEGDENALENNASNGIDAPVGVEQINSKIKKPVMNNFDNRVPYVNFFKSNRMMKPQYKLEYRDTGSGKIKINDDLLDSVEQTFGICLLGYVISGKPPTASLLDLVKRWGSNIKFHTYDNGWIVFTFPTVDIKERVLNGGPYMVYGFHLFLKEMPHCFRFRDEDMNSLPMWVQIHGLPLVCWNFDVLSIVASRVGIPIHMDMLTHDKKKNKFARVLIEVDASKPRVESVDIELKIGDIEIQFVYEQEIKFCEHCKRVGHVMDMCAASLRNKNKTDDGWKKTENNRHRYRSKSRNAHRNGNRSSSRVGFEKIPEASTSAACDSAAPGCSNVLESKNMGENLSPKKKNRKGKGILTENHQISVGLNCDHALVLGKQDLVQLHNSENVCLGNQQLEEDSSATKLQQYDSKVALQLNNSPVRRLRLDNEGSLDKALKIAGSISQGSSVAGFKPDSVKQQDSFAQAAKIMATEIASTVQSNKMESQQPAVLAKGKEQLIEEVSDEDLVGVDDEEAEVDYEVDFDNFKVVVNKKSKNQKKKDKKKENKKTKKFDGQDRGKLAIVKEFFKDMEDNSSGDTEYFLGSNNPKNDRFFGNMKKGRLPKIASVSL